MRFTKEHRIELPLARVIELTFDADFMRRMNVEAMKVQNYENLQRDTGAALWTMKNRITPQDNMPGFIKKIVGGTFFYEESVEHKPGSTVVTANMKPSVMGDKLRMGYTMRLRPDGDNACFRAMDWEVEVKIFGIGGQIEKFAAGEVERGVESTAAYMNKHGKAQASS